jgi:hypothetical protein
MVYATEKISGWIRDSWGPRWSTILRSLSPIDETWLRAAYGDGFVDLALRSGALTRARGRVSGGRLED